ncbi:hypothetical protein BGZ76_005181, partial [Entomortierella beljakovae]
MLSSSTTKTPTMKAQATWALSCSSDGDEHVSIRTFSEKFNYSDRNVAEKDYLLLINNSEISKPRRTQLKMDFERFNENRIGAEAYWVRRSTIIETAISAMNASVESMRAGYLQSKLEYKRHFISEDAQPSGDEIIQNTAS